MNIDFEGVDFDIGILTRASSGEYSGTSDHYYDYTEWQSHLHFSVVLHDKGEQSGHEYLTSTGYFSTQGRNKYDDVPFAQLTNMFLPVPGQDILNMSGLVDYMGECFVKGFEYSKKFCDFEDLETVKTGLSAFANQPLSYAMQNLSADLLKSKCFDYERTVAEIKKENDHGFSGSDEGVKPLEAYCLTLHPSGQMFLAGTLYDTGD